MRFKPKNAKTNNDSIEHRSIRCLEELLECDKLRTYFSSNDKTANIDGYIELLNDKKPIGKLTVQIKTFPKSKSDDAKPKVKKPKFNFPSYVFGYAESIPTDIVILFAVDAINKIAYWKHISSSLIKQYSGKADQGTISITFEQDEILTQENLDDVINRWYDFYNHLSTVIKLYDEAISENEQLKNRIKDFQSPVLSYSVDDIMRLQKFIEEYNYLLDKDFVGVKELFYSNTWKVGIAVFDFSTTSLSYLLYSILLGQNDLIIKEIPHERISEFFYFSRILNKNARHNPLKENPERYAFELISNDIKVILEKRSILFLTTEIAMEYIFDFVKREEQKLELKNKDWKNLHLLKDELERKALTINNKLSSSEMLIYHDVRLNNLYECVCFLLSKSIDKIYQLYPEKGMYGNSGWVYDYFTPQLAFEKIRFTYDKMYYTFNSFIQSIFPALTSIVDFYSGCNLLLVNLIYPDKDFSMENSPQLVHYYLYNDNQESLSEMINSLNFESEIYIENGVLSEADIRNKFYKSQNIFFKGNSYTIRKIESINIIDLLYNDYFIHNLLYDFLGKRIKEYLKLPN